MVEQTSCASFVATTQEKAFEAVPIKNSPFKKFGVQSSWTKSEEEQFVATRNWGLVGMFLDAYNTHHELILRPDNFWQAIVTQFSFYVNANSEALRDRIVDHEGKKELVVEGGGSFLTADYSELATRMVTEQIVKNIKDPSVAEWLQPDFSTTTPNDKVAACVSIMATLQAFFSYGFSLGCGLPKVTLKGTVEDWQQLRTKIDRLQDFDVNGEMSKWHKLLAKVMDKLVQSAQGSPCMEFWDTIISHIARGSGGNDHISGWASVFCVYNTEGKWIGKEAREGENGACGWPIVKYEQIANGTCVVPVKVNDDGVEYNTQMSAGHFLFTTKNDKTAICPSIDWVIELDEDYQKRNPKEEGF